MVNDRAELRQVIDGNQLCSLFETTGWPHSVGDAPASERPAAVEMDMNHGNSSCDAAGGLRQRAFENVGWTPMRRIGRRKWSDTWKFDADMLGESETQRAHESHAQFAGLDERADVSVIIVTYNSERQVGPLIQSLRAAARDHKIRVIVVDNGSVDDTTGLVRKHADIALITSTVNLGYAGGINRGMAAVGDAEYVFILNPDLTVFPNTIAELVFATGRNVGAAVPLMLDERDMIVPSLHREPSIIRSLCDSILGQRFASRCGLPFETDRRRKSYDRPHDVDWASGAAVFMPTEVVREVGEWNERFFLYSEEVEYFRRIRACNLSIRFQPSAVVRHPGQGSGSSQELAALLAVNRIRYVAMFHSLTYAAVFRVVVLMSYGLRGYQKINRYVFTVVARRSRWPDLPSMP